MNWGISLYNYWISVTALTAVFALILTGYYARFGKRAWYILAVVFFIICLECADSAITLGQARSTPSQVINPSVIARRVTLRSAMCAALFVLCAHNFFFFGIPSKRNSKDYPESGEKF